MRRVILVIAALLMVACVEECDEYSSDVVSQEYVSNIADKEETAAPVYIDINEYIQGHCDAAKKERIFVTIDDRFNEAELTIIISSIEYFNEVFDLNLQVCGVYNSLLYDGLYVRYGVEDDSPSETWVGSYNCDVITLFTERVRHYDHLRKVMLHELGHHLGAQHSSVVNDIMATGWHGVVDYSENDINVIDECITADWKNTEEQCGL